MAGLFVTGTDTASSAPVRSSGRGPAISERTRSSSAARSACSACVRALRSCSSSSCRAASWRACTQSGTNVTTTAATMMTAIFPPWALAAAGRAGTAAVGGGFPRASGA